MSRPNSGESHNNFDRNRSQRGVLLRNDAGTHEVEVGKVLNQWAVTVRERASGKTLADDFFDLRWKAVARAEDFVRLLNRSEPPHGWRSAAEHGARQV